MIATLVIGLLHHTDHVLRVDNSGWPFKSTVKSFTFSLLAYPILLLALLASRVPLTVRAFAVAANTVFTLYARIAIETPHMQYASWAMHRSVDAHLAPVPSLLGARVPEMGVVATAIGMALNALLLVTSVSLAYDAWRTHRKNRDSGRD